MIPLSASDAVAIWAVLEAHAGALDVGGMRAEFIAMQTDSVCTEFRFGGVLGFHGAFRRGRVWIGGEVRERWHVVCDPRDVTLNRRLAIEVTNQALAELTKERA